MITKRNSGPRLVLATGLLIAMWSSRDINAQSFVASGTGGVSVSSPNTWTATQTFTTGTLDMPNAKGAPSIRNAGQTTTGFDFIAAANSVDVYSAGTVRLRFADSLKMASDSSVIFTNGLIGGATDTTISHPTTGVVLLQGPSANGYLQQDGARDRVLSDVTNATTAFGAMFSTNTQVISGRSYTFRLVVFASDSTAADGGKLDFNGGSATATNFIAQCTLSSATGTTLAQVNAASNALATVINATTFVATTQVSWICNGTFEPSGGGTFIPRFAQNAHTAGTLTVLRGSYLWIEDTP